jgi:uncharacterized protein
LVNIRVFQKMSIKIVNKIKESGWDKLNNLDFPFLSYQFFSALEGSLSIGKEAGWEPLYFTDSEDSLLFSFIKQHSYGEYIFDWDWANFYHSHQIPYYPKLTSMIPFTSATTPHTLGKQSEELMNSYEEFYREGPFSSSHFLFLQETEIDYFKSFDYLIRDSFQYHFYNENYSSFDDFLSKIKTKKAKQIRKERLFSDNFTFQQISGEELKVEHALEMYEFYLETINNKGAIPYLTKNFFVTIFSTLAKSICYIQAKKNEQAIAGALYFFSNERLYGRYWGASEEYPNLHFELCYYQGIEFCIRKGLSVFEAGAQGEHKISRGFRPVKTYSAHKLKQPQIHQGIAGYIEQEKASITTVMAELTQRLPFKK